jgi:membrane associated rhomboid family serine protease
MVEELAAQGVGRSTSAPPAYRLAWRLGLRVRPPLYQSFAALVVGMGALFGVLWGLFMWVIFWRPDGHSPTSAIVTALVTGALFGLLIALFYRWKARSLRLPRID